MPGLILIGADHRVAPSDIRERLAVLPGEMSDVLGRLVACSHIREVFLLSGLNQTEVYLRGHSSALEDIRRFWQERAGLARDGLETSVSLYEKRDGDAAYHLFSLAAGLDRAVPAQAPALLQVKESLAAARAAGTVGEFLDPLLQRALRLARRVNRELGSDPAPEQAERARDLLQKEAVRFIRWARSRRTSSAITALKQRAEDIRQAELLRIESKLSNLSAEERQALEALTMSIVDKLINPPKKALKGAAELGEVSDYLRAASELFDLDES